MDIIIVHALSSEINLLQGGTSPLIEALCALLEYAFKLYSYSLIGLYVFPSMSWFYMLNSDIYTQIKCLFLQALISIHMYI